MSASNTLSGQSNDPTVIAAPCRPAAGAPVGGPRPLDAIQDDIHAEHATAGAIDAAVRYMMRKLSIAALAPQLSGIYPRPVSAQRLSGK